MEVKNTEDYLSKANEAADYIVKRLGNAEIAVILGSGLNNFTEELENPTELIYGDIPHIPQPTVKGHSGKLVSGIIGNKKVFCLAGRSHSYEGRHMYELTFLTRVLKLAGCKLMISTNASGGAMEGMYPGCLMIINDHINFYKRNPLADTCEHPAFGEHHTDLTSIYSKRLADIAHSVAKKFNIKLFEGVYGGTCGPTYETPSEVRAFSILGANCYGMSTMPETMATRSLGMESFAISLITNMASGLTKEVLTHSDVTAVANESGPAFVRFMKNFLSEVTVLPGALPTFSKTTPKLITPLPQPQFPSATQKQMTDASEAVKRGLKLKDVPSIAILLSEGHDQFLEKLSNKVDIGYRQIPYFPVTTASRVGRIVAGEISSKQVICLSGNALEGFSCEEGTFITELLRHIGAKIFVQTFISGATSSDQKLNQVVVLQDCVDSTTIHPFSKRIELPQYNVETKLFNEEFNKIVLSLNSESVEGTYCHIPGPSYPTSAEVNTARLINCKSVGMTSLPCIYSAKALGMEILAITENLYYKPISPLVTNTNLINTVYQFVEQVEIPQLRDVQFKDNVAQHQITYHLPPPVIQGVYDHVLDTANYIKNIIKNSAQVALVVDPQFDALTLSKLEVRHEFEYSKLPHMENYTGKLIFGELDGVPVYISQGTTNCYLNNGLPSSEISYYIRLLSVLDSKRILFVSPVCAINSSLNLGEISIVHDHVLLSGRSPLFGPNEDRWGTRFPDVGEAYNKEFQKLLFQSAESLQLKPLSITFGHVIGPVYGSLSDANYGQTLGLHGFCTGLAPEVVVARHMGVLVGAITVTTSSIPSAKSTKNIPENLDSLISKSIRATLKI